MKRNDRGRTLNLCSSDLARRVDFFVLTCECIAMMMHLHLQPRSRLCLGTGNITIRGGGGDKNKIKKGDSRPGLIIGVHGSDEHGGAHQ